MKSSHQHDFRRSHFILMCLLVGLELVCTASRLSASEQQPARHHSLIHRQDSDSRSGEPGTVAPTAPVPAQPDARSLHRKLTKRPRQTTITAPSAGSAQSTAPLSQAPSTMPNRLSTGGTAIATQAPVTNVPVSTTSTSTSVPVAGATPSTSKPAVASGLASAGIAAGVSSGSGMTGGRGMQRLVEQVSGLSQLLAPTLSAPAPPSSSSPPSSPPPPPSPPPPGTGSALLSWTPDSGSNLAGYKIYVGTAPGQYGYPGSPIVIGLASSYTLSNLPQGQTYYFAISAYTYSGTESGLSNEVSKSIY